MGLLDLWVILSSGSFCNPFLCNTVKRAAIRTAAVREPHSLLLRAIQHRQFAWIDTEPLSDPPATHHTPPLSWFASKPLPCRGRWLTLWALHKCATASRFASPCRRLQAITCRAAGRYHFIEFASRSMALSIARQGSGVAI